MNEVRRKNTVNVAQCHKGDGEPVPVEHYKLSNPSALYGSKCVYTAGNKESHFHTWNEGKTDTFTTWETLQKYDEL